MTSGTLAPLADAPLGLAALLALDTTAPPAAKVIVILCIWLGESALTNAGLAEKSTHDIEAWCDGAAAEFLVPAGELKAF